MGTDAGFHSQTLGGAQESPVEELEKRLEEPEGSETQQEKRVPQSQPTGTHGKLQRSGSLYGSDLGPLCML